MFKLPEPVYDLVGTGTVFTADQMQAAYQAGRDSDTALLRMALEVLKELWDNFGVVCPSADLIDQYEAAITALRERLGEKV